MAYDNASDLAERDEVWDAMERREMQRHGYVIRPISRSIPPTVGTAQDAGTRGPEPHPAAGDSGEQK